MGFCSLGPIRIATELRSFPTVGSARELRNSKAISIRANCKRPRKSSEKLVREGFSSMFYRCFSLMLRCPVIITGNFFPLFANAAPGPARVRKVVCVNYQKTLRDKKIGDIFLVERVFIPRCGNVGFLFALSPLTVESFNER